MSSILEWRWSDEPNNWRYDSHIQESFNNPQQLAEKRNENPTAIPDKKIYQIWRVRKI